MPPIGRGWPYCVGQTESQPRKLTWSRFQAHVLFFAKKSSGFLKFPQNLQDLPGMKFRNMDFAGPCFLHSPLSVLPLRVRIEARWSRNPDLGRVRGVFGFKNSVCRMVAMRAPDSVFAPFLSICPSPGPLPAVSRVLLQTHVFVVENA